MKHFFLPNLGISSKMKIGEISPKEKEGDFLFKKKKGFLFQDLNIVTLDFYFKKEKKKNMS